MTRMAGAATATTVALACCGPTTNGTRTRRLLEHAVAWASARPLSASYCHCELLLGGRKFFGIDSGGVHFDKVGERELARYHVYPISATPDNYAQLKEKCHALANSDDYECSSFKAIVARLWVVGPWLASWFPSNYSYCSELPVRVLHEVGLLTNLSAVGVSPNDIGHYFATKAQAELNV